MVERIKIDYCEYCNDRKELSIACICKEVYYCNENCLKSDTKFHQPHCKEQYRWELSNETGIKESPDSRKGLVGLQNLGNTCFMNTSLQCWSNCHLLTLYFWKEKYKKDINRDNPIGTGGILAQTYADLLNHLWYGNEHYFSPDKFKRALGVFQKMFTGYQQHDTQEFLNYLWDGLHEDLNRVYKKPFIEKDETPGEDIIVSNKLWKDFLRRNQSILVDLFYGQFKSTLVCPSKSCNNVSITFDPFLSISVPIPLPPKSYTIKLCFFYYDISIKPLFIQLKFYSNKLYVIALRNKIAKLLTIHPMSFSIVEMKNSSQIGSVLLPEQKLISGSRSYFRMSDNDYYVFQINPNLFFSEINIYNNEKNKFETKSSDIDEDANEIARLKEVNSLEYVEENTLNENIDNVHYGFDVDKASRVSTKIYDEERGKQLDMFCQRVFYFRSLMKCNEMYFAFFSYYYSIIQKIMKSENESEIKEHCQNNNSWDHQNIDEPSNPIDNKPELRNILSTVDDINSLNEYVVSKEDNINNIIESFNLFYSDLAIENISKNDFQIEQTKIPFVLRVETSRNWSYLNFVKDREEFIKNNIIIDIHDTKTTLKDMILASEISRRRLIFASNLEITDNNFDFCILISWNPKYESIWRNTNLNISNTPFKTIENKRELNETKEKVISIYDCLNKYTQKETLGAGNEWFCNKCKSHQFAFKTIEIYNPPNILIWHLKRFNNNSKIDKLIDFPLNNLDLSSYVKNTQIMNSWKYDWFAVGNHYGNMGFGHYTAFGKNYWDGKWYEFNDSFVSMKDEDDIVSSDAYVLFYKRQGIDDINWEKLYDQKFINYEPTKNDSEGPKKENEIESWEIPEKANDYQMDIIREEDDKSGRGMYDNEKVSAILNNEGKWSDTIN